MQQHSLTTHASLASPTKLVLCLIELTKIRITTMVLVACSIGYILAYRGDFAFAKFVCTLLGTALLSGGGAALNCYIERDADALMPRTCRRPIPTGMISPALALAFAVVLMATGFQCLCFNVNAVAALLGLTSAFIYIAIYTPAKRVTWLNTPIGALPGAIPPMIGWAAATGRIDAGAWALFAILFLWQHVHFFPIAWLYRSEYEDAGFKMLPVLERKCTLTFGLTVLSAILLLPVSLLLAICSKASIGYCATATIFGALLIAATLHFSRRPCRATARAVLLLCLFYLPGILTAVVVDRYLLHSGADHASLSETAGRWI